MTKNTSKPVIVFGASGALGEEIIKQLNSININQLGLHRRDYDLTSSISDLIKKLDDLNPKVIINCVSYNGYDKCSENPALAYEVNGIFPQKLQLVSNILGVKIIHISSEAVFLGDRMGVTYTESDLPNPGTIYGKSKYIGEGAGYGLTAETSGFHVIRLPLLFGPTNRGQIVAKLVKSAVTGSILNISSDVYSTPAYTPHVARKIISMALSEDYLPKIVHITSNHLISLSDFISGVLTKMGNYVVVKPVSSSYFSTKIDKPLNYGLSSIYKNYDNLIKFDESETEYVHYLKNGFN
jgi:dTDP-4-dehydrorhamnose reductase